ncbi:hypothetical protein [Aquisalimonas sp.]|uniref:hypothetical protein n=1 Tax=Aquisalimonas sp. TaxID=1872621 RepID=UPI0025BEE152|nr:hypothetical protein [Aquisalimonas sp.]
MDRSRAYPDAFRQREQARLNARRDAAGVAGRRTGTVGFGLSGGGVRSATFALGFFQGLARYRQIRYIDYLSTVSGGGYFGAFLGRLHTRECLDTVDDVEYVLGGEAGPESQPYQTSHSSPARDRLLGYRADVLRYLRENAQYLNPNGSGDTVLGGVVLLRNLISVHVALGLFVLLALFVLQLPYVLLAATDVMRVPPLRIQEPILLSPYIVPTVCAIALLMVPTGWAYWLVGHQRGVSPGEARLHALAPLVLVFLAGLAIVLFKLSGRAPANLLAWTLIAIGVLTLLTAILVDRHLLRRLLSGNVAENDPATQDTGQMRQRVSYWHMLALLIFAALLLITIVDTAGATLYWRLFADEAPPLSGLMAGGATLLGVLAAAQQLITRLAPRTGAQPGIPTSLVAWGLAMALLTLYLLVIGTLAHGISHGYALLLRYNAADPSDVAGRALYAALVLAAVVLLVGRLRAFVNRSGHHALYMARITRAFLGASNPLRHRGPNRSSLHVVSGDDAALDAYHAPPIDAASAAWRAAPLHLINVTVNETIDGRSKIQRRDRKGIGLAFGPCGMSLGVRHHALYPDPHKGAGDEAAGCCTIYPDGDEEYKAFAYPTRSGSRACPWEPLSVGALVAISGAAFSTGLGSRTSLPISVLCGLANLRLGYWWDSGVSAKLRGQTQPPVALWRRMLGRVIPIYSFLLAEILARFRGTVWRHWYLSDGGHFENLGGYELIRRRLTLIVILDAEADPDYTFPGLAGLIRKARIDFGADIEFLDADELEAMGLGHVFGSLDQMRRRKTGETMVTADGQPCSPCLSHKHFALAKVRYDDEPAQSVAPMRWLVYVKPTMTGKEPADLAEYLANHPSFPHQPTSDQFFDEDQWESYRMLGECMAQLLCQKGDSRGAENGWSFCAQMRQ